MCIVRIAALSGVRILYQSVHCLSIFLAVIDIKVDEGNDRQTSILFDEFSEVFSLSFDEFESHPFLVLRKHGEEYLHSLSTVAQMNVRDGQKGSTVGFSCKKGHCKLFYYVLSRLISIWIRLHGSLSNYSVNRFDLVARRKFYLAFDHCAELLSFLNRTNLVLHELKFSYSSTSDLDISS
jgi:hypothetical protein